MKRTTLSEKLWSKVNVFGIDECWIWTGAKDKDGYGLISQYDGIPRMKTSIGAHRAVWTLIKGDIPNGHYVCHHCDNPICVNPVHLFIGTGTDNMKDMWNKQRHRKPRKNPENGRFIP